MAQSRYAGPVVRVDSPPDANAARIIQQVSQRLHLAPEDAEATRWFSTTMSATSADEARRSFVAELDAVDPDWTRYLTLIDR